MPRLLTGPTSGTFTLISAFSLVLSPSFSVAQATGVQPVPLCMGQFGPGPCPMGAPPPMGPPSGFPQGPFGPPVLPVPTGSPQEIAIRCAQIVNADLNAFATCTGHRVILSERDQEVLDCAVRSKETEDFATCAAPKFGIKLSKDQKAVADCAMKSDGDSGEFATCAADHFVDIDIDENTAAAIDCAAEANGDTDDFTACAADYVIGNNATREQKIALQCAAESGADATKFAVCAGANLFSFNLNAEQQIAVQCVAQTGGEPYAAAGCMASRLTARELQKCLTDGFGGDGCFGDNNDLVGKNGWVARTFGQIAGGPNSFARNPGQIWGGENSFLRNPGQIWGGPNSFVRNPSQIWGGPNSVFNNPGQLIPPAPGPIEVGKVGNTRICIPWC